MHVLSSVLVGFIFTAALMTPITVAHIIASGLRYEGMSYWLVIVAAIMWEVFSLADMGLQKAKKGKR